MKFEKHYSNLHIYASFNDTTFDVYSYDSKIMIVDTLHKQVIINTKYLDYSPTTTRHFTKSLKMFGLDTNIKQIRKAIQDYRDYWLITKIQNFDILPIQ